MSRLLPSSRSQDRPQSCRDAAAAGGAAVSSAAAIQRVTDRVIDGALGLVGRRPAGATSRVALRAVPAAGPASRGREQGPGLGGHPWELGKAAWTAALRLKYRLCRCACRGLC
jgi:hypothetical protein